MRAKQTIAVVVALVLAAVVGAQRGGRRTTVVVAGGRPGATVGVLLNITKTASPPVFETINDAGAAELVLETNEDKPHVEVHTVVNECVDGRMYISFLERGMDPKDLPPECENRKDAGGYFSFDRTDHVTVNLTLMTFVDDGGGGEPRFGTTTKILIGGGAAGGTAIALTAGGGKSTTGSGGSSTPTVSPTPSSPTPTPTTSIPTPTPTPVPPPATVNVNGTYSLLATLQTPNCNFFVPNFTGTLPINVNSLFTGTIGVVDPGLTRTYPVTGAQSGNSVTFNGSMPVTISGTAFSASLAVTTNGTSYTGTERFMRMSDGCVSMFGLSGSRL